MQKFDLNIDKILENWSERHALREIMSNAIDEHQLSDSKKPEFEYQNGQVIIRDYGRGIKIKNFIQNENEEKLANKNLIGLFGIGLKDAIATFFRKNHQVLIISKYIKVSDLQMTSKEGTDEKTLHLYWEKTEKDFIGTEIIINNIKEEDFEAAKKFFLDFCDHQVLETTKFGQIIKLNDNEDNKIFINGLVVSSEPDFLFSYNITNVNKKVRSAMNRERNNLSRNVYSETIQKIIKNTKDNEKIILSFFEEFRKFENGEEKDEIKWLNIKIFIANEYSKIDDNVIYLTKSDLQNTSVMNSIHQANRTVVLIPNNLKNKIENEKEYEHINTFESFIEDYNNNFEYNFIEFNDLKKEKKRYLCYQV